MRPAGWSRITEEETQGTAGDPEVAEPLWRHHPMQRERGRSVLVSLLFAGSKAVFCLYSYWPGLPEGRGQGSGVGVGEVRFVEGESGLGLRANDHHGGLREPLEGMV